MQATKWYCGTVNHNTLHLLPHSKSPIKPNVRTGGMYGQHKTILYRHGTTVHVLVGPRFRPYLALLPTRPVPAESWPSVPLSKHYFKFSHWWTFTTWERVREWVYMSPCVYVCLCCVCMCVWERERERERVYVYNYACVCTVYVFIL